MHDAIIHGAPRTKLDRTMYIIPEHIDEHDTMSYMPRLAGRDRYFDQWDAARDARPSMPRQIPMNQRTDAALAATLTQQAQLANGTMASKPAPWRVSLPPPKPKRRKPVELPRRRRGGDQMEDGRREPSPDGRRGRRGDNRGRRDCSPSSHHSSSSSRSRGFVSTDTSVESSPSPASVSRRTSGSPRGR